MIHLAGPALVVNGRWHRQLCQWCGYRLVDEDLSLVMVPEGQEHGPTHFEVSAWIRVDEGCPTVFSTIEAPKGSWPAGACFTDVAPTLRAVPDPESGDPAP